MSRAELSDGERRTGVESDVFAPLIEDALNSIEPLSVHDYDFDRNGHQKKALDIEMLGRAARKRGLEVVRLSPTFQLVRDQSLSVGFYQNMSWSLSALDRIVTNDKQYAKRILARQGLPVARGEVVDSIGAALDVFRQMAVPVVVKPLTGSGGKGITVDIRTEAQLHAAVDESLRYGKRLLVEECIPSIDIRIMVVDGRAVAAMMRVPAHVVGDGCSSIADLVSRKNRVRAKNPYHGNSLIQFTDEALERLASQGLSLRSVLSSGQRAFLHYKANMSAGGDGVDVTSHLDPGLALLAEQAAACFPTAHHAGVDLLAQRLDRSPRDQHCVVSEVNCNNDVPIHEFPHLGDPVPSCELEIEGYFFSGRQRLRMPPELRARSRGPSRSSRLRSLSALWRRESRGARLPGTDWMVREIERRPVVGTVEAQSPRKLDQRQLSDTLDEFNWGKVRFDRRLVVGTRDGRDVVVDRSVRTVFATRLVSVRRALEALLETTTISYCRRGIFARDEYAEAKKLFDAYSGPWTVRSGDPRVKVRPAAAFRRGETLEKAWRRIGGRSSMLILEQAAEDHSWKFLVVRGCIVSCVGLCPPIIVGDGRATVNELVARRNAQRKKHPYLRHYPMPRSIPDKFHLEKQHVALSTKLARGTILKLNATTDVSSGADPVGYAGDVDATIVKYIDELLPALGNPQLMAVTFARRRDVASRWALLDVDVDPVLAEFAWPAAGKTNDIYRDVATLLESGQRYELTSDA